MFRKIARNENRGSFILRTLRLSTPFSSAQSARTMSLLRRAFLVILATLATTTASYHAYAIQEEEHAVEETTPNLRRNLLCHPGGSDVNDCENCCSSCGRCDPRCEHSYSYTMVGFSMSMCYYVYPDPSATPSAFPSASPSAMPSPFPTATSMIAIDEDFNSGFRSEYWASDEEIYSYSFSYDGVGWAGGCSIRGGLVQHSFSYSNSYDNSYSYYGQLWVEGDSRLCLRSKEALPGIQSIQSSLDKLGSCSDHGIVLSQRKMERWDWGSTPGAVRFLWNCDDKTIYGQVDEVDTGCSALRTYNVMIRVNPSMISFEDDHCGALSLRDSIGETAALYVYLGADEDSGAAQFNSITVTVDAPPAPVAPRTPAPSTSPTTSDTVAIAISFCGDAPAAPTDAEKASMLNLIAAFLQEDVSAFRGFDITTGACFGQRRSLLNVNWITVFTLVQTTGTSPLGSSVSAISATIVDTLSSNSFESSVATVVGVPLIIDPDSFVTEDATAHTANEEPTIATASANSALLVVGIVIWAMVSAVVVEHFFCKKKTETKTGVAGSSEPYYAPWTEMKTVSDAEAPSTVNSASL